jgi:hypothetical protein
VGLPACAQAARLENSWYTHIMRTLNCSVFLAVSLALGACGHRPPPDPQTAAPAASSSDGTTDPKWEGASSDDMKSKPAQGPGAGSAPATSQTAAPARRSDEYDKEQTEIALKRAARQVAANCGHAKDDNGKAAGPWGKVNMSVVLGHNGHSKGATIPSPYDGKPVGNCAIKAFTNLIFPPWGGADTTVDWEVEIVQPTTDGAATKQKK